MPIINIENNLSYKLRVISYKLKRPGLVRISFFLLLLAPFLSGCLYSNNLNQAQDDIRQSQEYYQRAVSRYKDLIAQGRDLGRLYFELGQAYYSHGDFRPAAEALKNSGLAEAQKILGLSYYHAGNFIDALEVFGRQENPDDESLYYHGLTCEKLNLFDQALGLYQKIKSPPFITLAKEQTELIQKHPQASHIKDIDPEAAKIIASAPAGEQYPQAGALILLADEKVEITSQGSQVSDLHYVVKVLNERGKEEFSEAQINYDSTYEKVELEYARTIAPDGTVTPVGRRHIRDVSKYLNFPLYSNARVYIISFPEISAGAVIEYKAKIYRNQLINKKDFVLSYPLETAEPVIAASFNLALPEERALHIKTINDKYNNFGAELAPKVSQAQGRIIYSWAFKNVPQIIPESNMPPDVQINPTLLVSTFDNWRQIYDWWWALSRDKLKADKAIKEKVLGLIRGQPSDEARARAIYNFCAKEIRYVAVEYGQAGYEPHFASDIFKNKYGDCKDQAVLLVTMLKEAGLPSWLVLIATKDYYNLDKDFPALFFDHCIAAVSLNNEIIFLDPTAETCSFADLPAPDQQRRVLVFKDSGYQIQETPLYPAEHNLIRQRLSLKINSDEGITAEKSVFSFGAYDQAQRYWILYTPPDLIRDTLQEKIQGVSIGAKLEGYNIENENNLNQPVILHYRFSGPEYCTIAGNLRILPQLAGVDTGLVAKDRRTYDLDYKIADTEETTFEIEIPQEFVIKYIPDSVSEENQWIRFLAEYKQEGQKIYFRQVTAVKQIVVSQEQYLDFKNFLEGLAKKTKQRIILEKAG